MSPLADLVTLVTGASSGIGEALARRLALDRHDLVLTARRADRLEALAHELQAAHGIRAHVIPADLSRPGTPTDLVRQIEDRGLTVHWLVNNAGFGTGGRFDELPVEGELQEIRLNVAAPVELTGRLLPGMVARGRGVVMNVSSMAGFGPMPFSATYAATKAFLLSFSEALSVEVSGTGVHIVCVCPGFTRTEFQQKAKIDTSALPSFAWMSAETVADQAVRAATRSGVLVNGTMNNLTTVFMRLAPRSLVARVAAAAMRGRV
jgi:short-subunit dehydrogenase